MDKLQKIIDWQGNKPKTNAKWAEDVKAESLDLKFDYQLEAMEDSHSAKLPRVQKDLDKFNNFPDAINFELNEQFTQIFEDQGNPTKWEGKTLQEWIDEEFVAKKLYYTWKIAKLEQSIERIKKERSLRSSGFVKVDQDNDRKPVDVQGIPENRVRHIKGTVFYIDPVNGTDSYTGTKITGTIDSTASTTTFIDSALTGVDDYINNSFFYNETTGKGTLIADFDDGDNKATLTDADGSMAAGNTYYILHAWLDLDQFTENSRSAGDSVIIRRGANQCDDGTDLNFTSDGTIADPILIEADYDNNWRDDVDLSATGTATLTFGSKTVTFSSDISSVLAAGEWIYAASDDQNEFAYEVASVSTVTATLFLPYKGGQAGSGKTMTNIQAVSFWNTATGNFQWDFDGDNFWKIQGLHIRGTDSNGVIEINTAGGHIFKDVIFETDAGQSNDVIKTTDDSASVQLLKCRLFTYRQGIINTSGSGAFGNLFIKDCLFDGNSSLSTTKGIAPHIWDNITIEESEFKGNGTGNGGDISFAFADGNNYSSPKIVGRNLILSSSPQVNLHNSVQFGKVLLEDFNGTLNDTRQLTGFSTTEGTPTIQSETGTVRTGGSTIAIKVTPTTELSTNWEMARLKLFDIPLYATTTSKTYKVYFRPTATADWTADPTATELWIELEYWGHASNNFRRITKSTGVIDMNGSTTFTALSVTVVPSQAGVAYLRCWYAKTKESSKANTFFVDPIPEIT